MAELMINDSNDVEEANNLLVEAGLTATKKDGSDNVLIIEDDDVPKVEAVLDASDIDYAWSGKAAAATAEEEEEEEEEEEDEDEDEN